MNRIRAARFTTLIALLLLSVPNMVTAQETPDLTAEFQAIIDNKSAASDSSRLHQLLELSWKYRMLTFPEGATYQGYPGQNDRWTDISLAAFDKRKDDSKLHFEAAESISPANLGNTDRLTWALFRNDLADNIKGEQFPGELMPISQMGGVHQNSATLLSMMPTSTAKDYENIVTRLSSLSTQIENTVILLKEGLKNGITPPRVTLRDVPAQVKSQIVDEPSEAPMLAPFKDFPDEVSVEDRTRLTEAALTAYTSKIVPALEKLHDYLADTYIPGCRESIGCSDLPNGKAWYAYRVRNYTTTDLTPDEIFTLGHTEVKRIRAEMERLIDSVGFEGDFEAFKEFMRTDPRFYFDEKEDLVREYRDISKRADAGLPALFSTLPMLPYGVIPIPSYSEKSQTTAYYQGGSLEAGRPGYYYVNTYDLKSRPKWEMEALTLHEAVPGHHLQISIAKEIENLPEFRKNKWYTAYGEGWALYAERLGEEMGFYKDPYSRFGQLTYEMWRAIRLVVDVGMHSKGWSRQQAIDFFKENASKTEHDITVEIDRYIVWPGQALAYKIGEIKIRELRAFAETELGDKFDIRAFHDELLGDGGLPLNILESKMKAWVAKQKG